ncbi:MAG TPA: CDP-alcohol phosphatidyltransferase family protein [Cyclobacteriaceae bacterium]|nr:CDP-alcohol phosphatidyltransferase family protein [Cyclobacteriaceae bacterium]
MRNQIPAMLIYSRLIVGIFILLLAVLNPFNVIPWITTLILIGFLSDIVDGIIARKLGVSTVSLRKLDSIVDRIFWLMVLITCFILYPIYMSSKWSLLASVLILEMIVFSFCLYKFSKIPSPHNFLAKLWGISIVLTLTEIVITGSSDWLFFAMILLGIASRVDSLIIHMLLRKWDHDIPSLYHAYLLRRGRSFKRNDLLNG